MDSLGQHQSEDFQLTILKALHLMGAACVFVFGVVFFVAGFPVVGVIELAFIVVLSLSFSYLHVRKSGVVVITWVNIVCVLLVTLSISLRLGGIQASGLFPIWSLISPLAAMIFLGRKETILVAALFTLCLVMSATVNLSPSLTNPVPRQWLPSLTVANVLGASALVFLTLLYFLRRLHAEHTAKIHSQRHLKALYDASPSMIVLSTPDGDVIQANRPLLDRLGRTHDELTQAGARGLRFIMGETFSFDDVVGGSTNEQGREPATLEWECLQKDGQVFPAEIRVRRLVLSRDGGSDRRAVWLTVINDISERVRKWETLRDLDKRAMDEERQKASRLESLGILAGGIAHDFNNFLTGILGNISLAKMKADKGMEITNNLSQAEAAVARAQSVSLQLLTFSKGGAPVTKVVDIAELLSKSAAFALRGSNVECGLRFAEDLHHVVCDPGQIGQVIHNLLINAAQAMPRGGIVEISADNATFDDSQVAPTLTAGKYVRITVVDEGDGIPEENIERVFDPYFTTRSAGSGLGLASTYHIVEKHNGAISVTSTVGQGSAFTFFLPASCEVPSPQEHKAIADGGGRTILVMDDDQTIRDMLSLMLAEMGYSVIPAQDGQEAIDLYKRQQNAGHAPDAVILDLTVTAGMGGTDAIVKLRELDPKVKAIVSTGYYTHPVMSNPQEAGFSAAIAKPFTVAQLSQALDSVIAGPVD